MRGAGRFQGVLEFLCDYYGVVPFGPLPLAPERVLRAVISYYERSCAKGYKSNPPVELASMSDSEQSSFGEIISVYDAENPDLMLDKFLDETMKRFLQMLPVTSNEMLDLADEHCNLDFVDDVITALLPEQRTQLTFKGRPLNAALSELLIQASPEDNVLMVLNKRTRELEGHYSVNALIRDDVMREYTHHILLHSNKKFRRLRETLAPPMLARMRHTAQAHGSQVIHAQHLSMDEIDEDNPATTVDAMIAAGTFSFSDPNSEPAMSLNLDIIIDTPPLGLASTVWREVFRFAAQLYRKCYAADGYGIPELFSFWNTSVEDNFVSIGVAAGDADARNTRLLLSIGAVMINRIDNLTRTRRSKQRALDQFLYEVWRESREHFKEFELTRRASVATPYLRGQGALVQTVAHEFATFYGLFGEKSQSFFSHWLNGVNDAFVLVFPDTLRSDSIEAGVIQQFKQYKPVTRDVVQRQFAVRERLLPAGVIEEVVRFLLKKDQRLPGVLSVTGVEFLDVAEQAMSYLPERNRRSFTLWLATDLMRIAKNTNQPRCALLAVPPTAGPQAQIEVAFTWSDGVKEKYNYPFPSLRDITFIQIAKIN
jgi:hypothetical protein